MRRVRLLASLLLAAFAAVTLLVGCGDDTAEDTEIANPAAVYCEEQGGTVSGPEPMCTLPDGTVVDAWDHYRETHPEPSE
jgi:putative hemolysin